MKEKQRRNDASDTKRRCKDHHEHRRERPNLEDDHREHQHDHHGKYRGQCSVRFSSFFYIAAHFDLVALGQACDDRLNCLLNLLRDLWRLKGFVDVTLYRNRRQAITTFEDRIFRANLDVPDLTQWNSLTRVIHQSHIVQLSRIEAVGPGASSDNLHRSNVFADLRDWRTGQEKLDLLRSVLGRKAD